jgi:ribose transport system permease protein
VAITASKSGRRDPDLSGRGRALLANQQFLLVIALAVLIIAFTLKDSVFDSSGEITNILDGFCSLVLLAVGETYVIVSGGIDLSVGSTASLSGVIGAFAVRGMVAKNESEVLVLLLATAVCGGVGIVVGLINAALMNYAKLVPFVATLATLGGAAGLALVLSNGAPIGSDTKAILFGTAKIGPFSWPALIVIAIVAVAWAYMHFSRFGRYTFAIGSNPFAARAAGINVRRHLSSVYVLSGLMAGLTGMFLYIRLGSGSPASGVGAELEAIAAVVIGGASLTGGVGRLTGSILGAGIIAVVTSGLIIANVQPNWNQVAVAGLIAAAAALQALRSPART